MEVAAVMRRVDPDTVTVLRVVTDLALTGEPFSADDVRLRLAARGWTVHPNAVGAAVRIARTTGLIREIGTQRSRRAAARSRRVGVYVGAGRRLPEDRP